VLAKLKNYFWTNGLILEKRKPKKPSKYFIFTGKDGGASIKEFIKWEK